MGLTKYIRLNFTDKRNRHILVWTLMCDTEYKKSAVAGNQEMLPLATSGGDSREEKRSEQRQREVYRRLGRLLFVWFFVAELQHQLLRLCRARVETIDTTPPDILNQRVGRTRMFEQEALDVTMNLLEINGFEECIGRIEDVARQFLHAQSVRTSLRQDAEYLVIVNHSRLLRERKRILPVQQTAGCPFNRKRPTRACGRQRNRKRAYMTACSPSSSFLLKIKPIQSYLRHL